MHIIGDFLSFLLASASNNAFIIKMWPGGTVDVVVRTLKISFNLYYFAKEEVSYGDVVLDSCE